LKRLLLVLALFVAAFVTPAVLQAKQKVIYLSYHDDTYKENIPERVYNGQYFSITIKTLSTIRQHHKLKYSFKGARGVTLQDHVPQRKDKDSYVLDTFFFLATSRTIILPNITASIGEEESTLMGEKIEGVSLNPDQKFAGILADSFKVNSTDEKKYDNKHNIVPFDGKEKHYHNKAFQPNVAN